MKEWKKPELTILVRNKPEEAVLSSCKQGDGYGGAAVDPTEAHEGCTADDEFCGGCDALSAS